MMKGDAALALRHFDEMLRADPNDIELALRHFGEMLRTDPNDIEAQYGSGQAYLELRRFRDAALAFERVIGRLPRGESSTAYDDAAIAYLALGEDGRAEVILATRYGAAAAKSRLTRLREAARKR
jgi:tetratricopeptide (TPR) repeat protein